MPPPIFLDIGQGNRKHLEPCVRYPRRSPHHPSHENLPTPRAGPERLLLRRAAGMPRARRRPSSACCAASRSMRSAANWPCPSRGSKPGTRRVSLGFTPAFLHARIPTRSSSVWMTPTAASASCPWTTNCCASRPTVERQVAAPLRSVAPVENHLPNGARISPSRICSESDTSARRKPARTSRDISMNSCRCKFRRGPIH